MRQVAFALVVIGSMSIVHAQQRGGGAFFVRTGVQAETVKSAPYSADVVNESVQTLTDGNRIVQRSTSHMYRDTDGRVRREEERGGSSPVVTITDPMAGMSWTLDVDNRTARQMPGVGRIFSFAGARDDMYRLEVALNGVQEAVRLGPEGRGWVVAPGSGGQPTEEKLSPKTIEGLRVEGVRRTSTIASGTIGNERAIVVTTEEWTSPDLKVLVLSEHADPRSGTSTYKLVNVRRVDPPASLFQVPPDYIVVQGPGIGGGRGDGRGTRGGAPR
jgi:hypothetical protein